MVIFPLFWDTCTLPPTSVSWDLQRASVLLVVAGCRRRAKLAEYGHGAALHGLHGQPPMRELSLRVTLTLKAFSAWMLPITT